jgi:hypothetical protein
MKIVIERCEKLRIVSLRKAEESGTAQGSIGIAFNAVSVLAWNHCAWNLFLKMHVLIYFSCL